MSNSQDYQKKQDDSLLLFVFFCIGLVMLYYFYDEYKIFLHFIMLKISYYQFYFFSLFGFETAKEGVEMLKDFDLESYSDTETYIYLLGKSSEYSRWIICFFMLYGCRYLWKRSFLEKFQFNMTPDQLVEMNSRVYPKIRPVLFWNINKESTTTGPWKLADQPIQFAVRHELLILPDNTPVDANLKVGKRGLVLDETYSAREDSPCLPMPPVDGEVEEKYNPHYALRLDENKTNELFARQVNKRFELSELKDYEKAILAAHLCFACDNKKEAQKIFDYLSTTFKVIRPKKSLMEKLKLAKKKQDDSETYFIKIPSNTNSLIKKYMKDERIQDLMKAHGYYFYPFMLGLSLLAKNKGVLSTAEFIWLRPMDRLLFLILNAAGGPACHTECSGVFAHFEAEDVVGKTLSTIYVQNATEALHARLENAGFLPVKYTKINVDESEQAKAVMQKNKARGLR